MKKRKTPLELDELFREVINVLSKKDALFAIAGGFAASLYRVEKRMTVDIDLLLSAKKDSQKLAEQIVSSFGMKPLLARKADLDGGPKFAIKRKNTVVQIVVGRHPQEKDAAGLDFILPEMPWVPKAIERAQKNTLDFGFGPIPTITVEDLIIAKVFVLKTGTKREKDIDDLRSIFEAKHDLDLPYLTGQMRALKVHIPKTLLEDCPETLAKISKSIERETRKIS